MVGAKTQYSSYAGGFLRHQNPCHKHGLGVWHKLPCMVKDFVFGAGHPKVCLGFSHGHITAVAPVLVCMRWMAQSFRGQGWREGFGVASYWWKGDLMFTVSGRKEKKKEKVCKFWEIWVCNLCILSTSSIIETCHAFCSNFRIG